MVTRYTHKNLVWIDLESPTQDEVRSIMKEFNINPLAAEELLTPTLKPKVDVYQNFIYLILHFPVFKHTHKESRDQEVDFLIGKDFLITARYDTIDPIHKFSKVFEVDSILDRSDMGNHAGYLFFYMIKKLYGSIMHELAFIRDSLDSIEEQIFSDKEREMVIELSRVARHLLHFKQALSVHHEVLSSFEIAGKRFFGDAFGFHLRTLIGEYYKIEKKIAYLSEGTAELRETNNALLSSKQNEVMRILTVLAFAVLPITLLSQIFSMNTKFIPIIGSKNDFWIIIGIMVIVAASCVTFFKYKKWL